MGKGDFKGSANADASSKDQKGEDDVKQPSPGRPPPGFWPSVRWGISNVWQALVDAADRAIRGNGTTAIGGFVIAVAIGGSMVLLAACMFVAQHLGLDWPRLELSSLPEGGAISGGGVWIFRAIRNSKK